MPILGYFRLKMPSPIEDVKDCCETYLEIQTAKLWQSVEIQTVFVKSIGNHGHCDRNLECGQSFIENIWKCGLKLSKFYGIQVLESTKKVWSDLLYRGRALFIWKSTFRCCTVAQPLLSQPTNFTASPSIYFFRFFEMNQISKHISINKHCCLVWYMMTNLPKNDRSRHRQTF